MTQLKIVDESLQISLNGIILLVTPKNLCAIDVLSLYDDVPYISIYNKFLGNSTTIFNQALSTCEDSTGTPFTFNSFVAFAEANLGFDTTGGGGGCCGTTSPFKYDANGTGIEPILGSNNASGTFATISGGACNTASNKYASIGGGYRNTASNNYASIGGGYRNTASNRYATIGGGRDNTASEFYATIGGGSRNTAINRYATIGGGFCNNASGCCTIIGGGKFNTASGCLATIGGGCRNNASNKYATIGGGRCNTASANYDTIAGGYRNTASGIMASIGGGSRNTASKCNATIGGGNKNTASAYFATIGGGYYNTASGCFSGILGGQNNNTCNFTDAMIVGSNLCATQGCTTFMNCVSANNLTVGCFVCTGTNKVLQDVPFSPSRGLFAQTSLGNQIVFASGEASLIGAGVGTLIVPANAFQVGDSFTARLCGYLSSANNQDIHIRVKSNGTVIADAGVFTLSITTNKYFELTLDFTITKIGGVGVAELFTNGLFTYNKNANANIDGVNFALISNTVFDTTISNTLSITAEWVTSNASNKIQSQNFVLTKVF